MLSGVVNVACNLFFVIVLHMGVAGVATATVIAQVISAALIVLFAVATVLTAVFMAGSGRGK